MPERPDRLSLAEARALIDLQIATTASVETAAAAEAAGRVLAAVLHAPADWPPADRAAVEGYALRAAETEGAGCYAPVLLRLSDAPGLPAGGAMRVGAGDRLPSGADAVLPHAAAQAGDAAWIEALDPVASGFGVERHGSVLRAGAELLPAGRRLRPQDVALLVGLGVGEVAVIRQPRLGLALSGPHAAALRPMLRALAARDGGLIAEAETPDLLLVAGPDCDAEALPRCQLALRPGEQVGIGRLGGVPALRLPEAPADCLAVFDMLAGPLVRRWAGLPPGLAYATAEAVLERKIVSAIGFTDLVRVRLAADRATPLGAADGGGLASLVRADGFVVVPDGREGAAPGSPVRVHLYDAPSGADGA